MVMDAGALLIMTQSQHFAFTIPDNDFNCDSIIFICNKYKIFLQNLNIIFLHLPLYFYFIFNSTFFFSNVFYKTQINLSTITKIGLSIKVVCSSAKYSFLVIFSTGNKVKFKF